MYSNSKSPQSVRVCHTGGHAGLVAGAGCATGGSACNTWLKGSLGTYRWTSTSISEVTNARNYDRDTGGGSGKADGEARQVVGRPVGKPLKRKDLEYSSSTDRTGTSDHGIRENTVSHSGVGERKLFKRQNAVGCRNPWMNVQVRRDSYEK
jgi:hypothetical protein